MTNGMKTKIHPIDEFQIYLSDTVHHDLFQWIFFLWLINVYSDVDWSNAHQHLSLSLI